MEQSACEERKEDGPEFGASERQAVKADLTEFLRCLAARLIQLQSVGELKTIGWISFMFLRGGIERRAYDFRVDLYDEHLSFLPEGPLLFWRPPLIFEAFERARPPRGGQAAELSRLAPYLRLAQSLGEQCAAEFQASPEWKALRTNGEPQITFEHFLTSYSLSRG